MQFDDFPEMAKKFCPQCGTKITDHMGRPRSFCSERSFIIVKIVYFFVDVIKGVFKSVLLCIFLYNRSYFFCALNATI